MLKILDRYLIKKYLSTYFFALLIFSLISIAIDFSEKVKSFIDSACTVREIVFDYYIGFVLYMAGLLMPLYTLIAVVFFTSRIAFNAEILSIFNAGASFGRLLRPYLIAAGVVATLHFSFNHFIIPKFNKARLKFERTYVWTDQEKGKSANLHMLLSPDTKVYIQGYNKNNQTATGMRLEKFTGNKIISITEAQTAKYKEDKNRWELQNYTVRSFDGMKETFEKHTKPIDTLINLSPQDFIWYHNQNEEMTSFELMDAARRDRIRGLLTSRQYDIEFHRRTADAFTNIILTIIGLAVAGRKVRGGMGLHLAIGIGLGAVFILLSKFTVTFAVGGAVPVLVGIWIPNILFGGIAAYLVARAQK
jgi:lipopolysaccharide export system permease protein